MITLVTALGIVFAMLVTAALVLAGFALAKLMIEEAVPTSPGSGGARDRQNAGLAKDAETPHG